jgi:hypothetical protein
VVSGGRERADPFLAQDLKDVHLVLSVDPVIERLRQQDDERCETSSAVESKIAQSPLIRQTKIQEMPEKPSVTLSGTVDKIIPPRFPLQAETVQISVETPDELYREVRIENMLTDENGDKVRLKVGSPVEITIAAEAGSTTVKSPASSSKKP